MYRWKIYKERDAPYYLLKNIMNIFEAKGDFLETFQYCLKELEK